MREVDIKKKNIGDRNFRAKKNLYWHNVFSSTMINVNCFMFFVFVLSVVKLINPSLNRLMLGKGPLRILECYLCVNVCYL